MLRIIKPVGRISRASIVKVENSLDGAFASSSGKYSRITVSLHYIMKVFGLLSLESRHAVCSLITVPRRTQCCSVVQIEGATGIILHSQ
jgi:hypothetical protein